MSQDQELTKKKLSALWDSKEVEELDTEGKKYVIMSDVHLGDGGRADDLRRNERALETALDYYNKNGYSLILLGDIEEFWQFDLAKIAQRYRETVYSRIRAFKDERVYRVWGNHDSEWGTLDDPARNRPIRPKCAEEALKMKDKDGKGCILLVHGHQGSTESDKDSWCSRFWVRMYRKIEPYIKIDPHRSATKSQITKDYERILYSWAKNAKCILICGHSHRAIFASKSYVERLEEEIRGLQRDNAHGTVSRKVRKQEIKERKKKLRRESKKGRRIDPAEPHGEPLPCYFNTGCALYTDGITAIEIAKDEIRLVKWDREVESGAEPEEYQSGSLSEYIDRVVRSR